MFARRLLRGRALAIAVPAAIVTVGVSVVAVAAIPGSGGKISGCYEPRTGLLRVIDAEAGRTCTRFETAISWNVTGPKGDTGATGAAGAQGEKGEPGATGAQGEAGAAGAQGEKGDNGATGAQGEKGDTGATVAQGPAGAAGATNITMRNGVGTVECLPCETVTGGGGQTQSPSFALQSTRPTLDANGAVTGWQALRTTGLGPAPPVFVYVLCAAP